MLTVAIFLFVIAAAFGLVLLSSVLKNQTTSKPVAIIHGVVAGIALLIAITYLASGHSSPLILSSVIIFAIAALGGLTMFTMDISKKPIPKIIAVIHPLLAVTALVLLVIYVLQ